MTNFAKPTLLRIGRLLPGAETAAPLARLMAWTSIPRKSIYNWTLESADPQYREMPPVAKRLVTILAYFAMTGQLTEKRLDEIAALEEALADDAGFQKLANRMRNLLKKDGIQADEAANDASAPIVNDDIQGAGKRAEMDEVRAP